MKHNTLDQEEVNELDNYCISLLIVLLNQLKKSFLPNSKRRRPVEMHSIEKREEKSANQPKLKGHSY